MRLLPQNQGDAGAMVCITFGQMRWRQKSKGHPPQSPNCRPQHEKPKRQMPLWSVSREEKKYRSCNLAIAIIPQSLLVHTENMRLVSKRSKMPGAEAHKCQILALPAQVLFFDSVSVFSGNSDSHEWGLKHKSIAKVSIYKRNAQGCEALCVFPCKQKGGVFECIQGFKKSDKTTYCKDQDWRK